MSDLGDIIKKFYAVPGVLGIRGKWEHFKSLHIVARFDTPELRAGIERVLRGKSYRLEVLPMPPERALELDATIRDIRERTAKVHDMARVGVCSSGWGAGRGAYGRRLKMRRVGRNR